MALECLDLLSRSSVINNFYTLHNDWRQMGIGLAMDWAPVQLDANMGWTAAVQEMLLYSEPGLLKILPALPSKWRRGRVQGLSACGGIEVDIGWDGEQGRLEVKLASSTADQRVLVKLPEGAETVEGRCTLRNTAGQRAPLAAKQGLEIPLRLHAGEATVLTAAFRPSANRG
ncbi:glycoside hydrolase family 95-like protein [Paenibacillus sp. JTLBN-2024]